MPPKASKGGDFALQLQGLQSIVAFRAVKAGEIQDDSIALEYFVAQLELLEQYWQEFYERHCILVPLQQEYMEHEYFSQDGFRQGQQAYVFCKSVFKAEIRRLTTLVIGDRPAQNDNVARSVQGSAACWPKQDVPKFSGKQCDWESFKENFEATVINDTSLPEIRKLGFLLNAMEGSAVKVLKGTKVTGANFQVSWEKLLRRFDDKEVRLSAHLDAILEAKPMQKRSADEIAGLLDVAEESFKGLKELDCPVDQYDVWFVHLIVKKLDYQTRESWAIHNEGAARRPIYKDLIKFLENRIHSLEQSALSSDVPGSSKKGQSSNIQAHATVVTDGSIRSCIFCNKINHKIYKCLKFMKLTVGQRLEKAKQLHLCFICLQKHYSGSCQSKYKCSACGSERHNTLLHLDQRRSQNQKAVNVVQNDGSNSKSDNLDNRSAGSEENAMQSCNATIHSTIRSRILLATAKIVIRSENKEVVARALIDPGSECTLVTKSVVQALNLKLGWDNTRITGVSGKCQTRSEGQVNVRLESRLDSEFSLDVNVVVLNTLTANLPQKDVKHIDLSCFEGIRLADPDFQKSRPIDCIIGADVYPFILKNGLRKSKKGDQIAQNTVFGWIISGAISQEQQSIVQVNCAVVESNLNVSNLELSKQVEKFWEVELISLKKANTPEENACEKHFQETFSRNSKGRYMVRLPFKTIPNFPNSRQIALSQIYRLKKRFEVDTKLKEKYDEFMSEYLSLGHMEVVPEKEINKKDCYYVPHHAVFRNNKIRVVFNASFPNFKGQTLNDIFMIGPKLQTDSRLIIIAWRFFRFVFTADMVKMYRQFLIDPRDRDWLRILYIVNQKIVDFRLSTVTYGTSCAPYLALRVILQAIEEIGHKYQKVVPFLKKLRYIDDIFCGADSIKELKAILEELIAFMAEIGIDLDKWAANVLEVLQDNANLAEGSKSFSFESSVTALGISWDPKDDAYFYTHSLKIPEIKIWTKRKVLSVTAQFFDPSGWVAPVAILFRIFLQILWMAGYDWDQPLMQEHLEEWLKLLGYFKRLSELKLSRWLGSFSITKWILHCFGDASKQAIAACAYFVPEFGESHLICAKARVAPIKTISIAKLELCAAVLVTELVVWLKEGLPIPPERIVCWTDSLDVFWQLKTLPSKLGVFESHRVGKILTLIPDVTWRHVRSGDNPADCATRGLSIDELLEYSLWWHGPNWIQNEELWPKMPLSRKVNHNVCVEPEDYWLEHFSKLNHLYRSVAYMRRWLPCVDPSLKFSGPLKPKEIAMAEISVIKFDQKFWFQRDIELLETKGKIFKKSPLKRLGPFLDGEGILRLGGRLEDCPILTYEEKHPILLAKSSHLARLLVTDAHRETLHGGPRLMLSHINRRFWIANVRRLLNSIVYRCPICTRFSNRTMQQKMANLPESRLKPERPFSVTGVDYAGPFKLTLSRHRGVRSTKGYVAVFVCFVTRAVHLEVVSSLEATSFIAAFDRLVSRRGPVRLLYSDNATNFQGAKTEIHELFQENSEFFKEVLTSVESRGTEWSMIPPRSPHFGGLWEAAVKSFKFHFQRIIGETVLTFEEMSTLVCKIEACLNSRPLCAVSLNNKDPIPLTPGHLLVGTEILARPEPILEIDLSASFKSVWIQISNLRDHFWRHWRSEVLNQFKQINKWQNSHVNLQVGDLVFMKDNLSPPTQWPLAQLIKVYPGKDGLVRVVQLKTSRSVFIRGIENLILLPTEEQISSHIIIVKNTE